MFSKRAILSAAVGAALAIGAAAIDAQALRLIAPRNQPAAGGMVNLPYSSSDNSGNQWLIYQYGQFQQQGNMPVYSQGGMLQINGQYAQVRNNQGRIDEKTGELVLENMQAGGIGLTRRILFNKEEGWVRYVDILKNSGNAEVAANLVYNTNLNYGVQGTSTVTDPKKKEQTLAWVAQTHANGRTVVEMFGGKGAKTVPQLNYQQGNSNLNATLQTQLGGGREIAIMHFHVTTTTQDAGTKFVLNMKESKMLASIPAAIRKLIINFRGGDNFIGDFEILRGELMDVVELRSGDQLKGTIKEKTYKLETFYGAVELTPDKVIGLINAGEFRPRQLVVTRDGEVYGGKLGQEKLTLELSSGQITEIPLNQISRMGYRKRAGEVDEWTFEKPLMLMRSGDRIGIKLPDKDVEAHTRYGSLKLKPSTVASINFQSEEHGVHEIYLSDGSHFAGLIVGDIFEMKLSGEGPEQTVRFPASSIRRMQMSGRSDEPEPDQALLNLANDDLLVGSLAGALKLDTAFSTINLNAGEIKKLTHVAGTPADVQVVLWDETTVSGQLQDAELSCELISGVTMRVPVALVEDYVQPRPQPSAAVVESIKTLITQLNAEDWKQRDAAQEKLVAMGPVVVNTIKSSRATQSPEAQQRIDLILKQLGQPDKKPTTKPAAAGNAGTAPGLPAAVPQELFIRE